MKKIVASMLIAASLLISSRSSSSNNVNGKEIPYYGLFNPEDKQPNVVYKVSMFNVVVGAIFCETVVVPVVVLGWMLYEPVATK